METRNITFISAGAGSGKTYRLTSLLHDALAKGTARPRGVLATTFTRKAAAELRERVRTDLLGRGEHALANAMGQALIGTINSVCGDLIGRFSFELGLSCRLQVLDEEAAAAQLRRSLDAVRDPDVARNLADLAYRLDIEDWSACVAAIVSHARLNNIGAQQLADFGRQNADDLLALFPAAARHSPDADLASAIDLALPALEKVAAAEGKKNTAGYLEQVRAFRSALATGSYRWCDWSRLSGAAPQASLRDDVESIAAIASLHASHPQLHRDIREYLSSVFTVAASVLDEYARAKKELGVIDFADQEHLLLSGLDHPVVQEVLREELDLLLVDEFQDTSPIQLALFMKLATLARKTYWVGDVKQAIYGFRGSDTALMKSLLDQLPQLGGRKEVLDRSWRSRPALVDAVNAVFVPAFAGVLPAADVALTPSRTETGPGAAIMHWTLDGSDISDRIVCLAGGVEKLVASGYLIEDRRTGGMRPVAYRDIAVLARTNERVEDIAAALRARGVPAAIAQPGLVTRPETVLALACLRRLLDAGDTIATAEILSLADCSEPEEWLTDRLQWLADGKDSRAWREHGETAHPILARLADLRAHLPAWSPREALQAVVTRAGLAARILRWCPDKEAAKRRLANLDALLDLATRYEETCEAQRASATLPGLLIWLDSLRAKGKDALAEPAMDAVSVLTHHGAKGLEWPVVILYELDAALRDNLWSVCSTSRSPVVAEDPLRDRFIRYWPWPFGKQQNVAGLERVTDSATAVACQEQAQAEAVRLLYVSMTRARDCMVLATPATAKRLPWLDTAGGRQLLGAGPTLVLSDRASVPYARWDLVAPEPVAPRPEPAPPSWYPVDGTVVPREPLTTMPSAAASISGAVTEAAELGPRTSLRGTVAPDNFGTAVHACFAVALGPSSDRYTHTDTERILQRYGVQAAVDTTAFHASVLRFRDWIQARWPGATVRAEVPVEWKMPDGRLMTGQIDALVETGGGWVIIDHKSGPYARDEWAGKADQYGGQLRSYARALEGISGRPVESVWLHFPLGGGAVRVETATRGLAAMRAGDQAGIANQ